MLAWLKAYRQKKNRQRLERVRCDRARIAASLFVCQWECQIIGVTFEQLERIRVLREGIKHADDYIEYLEERV